VAAGDAEESFLSKSKKLRDEEKEKLTFLSRHGITHNKDTIWALVKRHHAMVAALKKRLYGREFSDSKNSEQLLLFRQRR